MYTIIPLLLAHIQELYKQISFLFKFIEKSKDDSLFSPKYNKLKVDKLPTIHVPVKKDYKQLLELYLKEHDKPLKPIKSRGKHPVPEDVHCPCCNAPHDYIYDNTGGRGQFLCKVCNTHFNRLNYIDNPPELCCPHCGKALVIKKKRKLFNIHKCVNPNCSYYLHSLQNLSREQLEEYKSNPEKFKLHYIYREFKINFFKIDLYSLPKHASSLVFRKFSPHVMGLCLTYLVNCGMSTRDTVPCILAIRMAFDKFKKFPGKALKFVADGFSAYQLARQQFALHDIDFDVTQVTGLTNDDEVSKEYRWLKQNIERLNRTSKFSYRVTNGYGSNEGASTHLALFVAYYNFLRPHPYNYWRPLNEVKDLEKAELMPAKWQILIELSQQLIINQQKT